MKVLSLVVTTALLVQAPEVPERPHRPDSDAAKLDSLEGKLVELPCREASAACFERLESEFNPRLGMLGCVLGEPEPGDSSLFSIARVEPGSPCAQAGVEPSDRLLSIESIRRDNFQDVQQLERFLGRLLRLKADVSVSIEIGRREEVQTLRLVTVPLKENLRQLRLLLILQQEDPELARSFREFLKRRSASREP